MRRIDTPPQDRIAGRKWKALAESVTSTDKGLASDRSEGRKCVRHQSRPVGVPTSDHSLEEGLWKVPQLLISLVSNRVWEAGTVGH